MYNKECNIFVVAVTNRGRLTDAVFDFEAESDFVSFCLGNQIDPYIFRDRLSLYVEVTNLPSSLCLRAEEYYKLNLALLNDRQKYVVSPVRDNSVFFYSINDISKKDDSSEEDKDKRVPCLIEKFAEEEKPKRRKQFKFPSRGDASSITLPNPGAITIAARYVGEGNWNEVCFDEELGILYDAGYTMHASDHEVRAFLDQRHLEASLHHLLCLSHWDMDHYRALTLMTRDEVNKFKNILVPDLIPSCSAERMINWLADKSNYNGNLIVVDTDGRNPHQYVSCLTKAGSVNFFVCHGLPSSWTSGSASNMHCLTIHVLGSDKVAYFTGDSFYRHLMHSMNLSGVLSKESILIVPHHGAKADTVNVIQMYKNGRTPRMKWPASIYPVLSTAFYYRHPHNKAIELLVNHAGAKELFVLSRGNDYVTKL